MCIYNKFPHISSQVVYAIAYEGARLEIPEGPLGKLIAGLVTCQSVVISFFLKLCLGFMEYPFLMCCLLFADCWTEPEQRPSCNEILSRLLDCEYSLC